MKRKESYANRYDEDQQVSLAVTNDNAKIAQVQEVSVLFGGCRQDRYRPSYMERAVQALRESGQDIDDTLLSHLSPLGWKLTGDYIWQQDKRVEGGASSGRYEHRERLSVRFFPFHELTP